MSDAQIGSYILAGGQSRRMGTDKARIPYQSNTGGQSWIQAIAQQIRQFSVISNQDLFIVASEDDAYQDLGLVTIADKKPHLGPLHGLKSALDHANQNAQDSLASWVLVCACDHTYLKEAWINKLWLAAKTHESCLAITFKHRHWEPMPGLFHLACLEKLERFLNDDNKHAFQSFLDHLQNTSGRTLGVPLPDDWPRIPQINTPQMLQDWQKTRRIKSEFE